MPIVINDFEVVVEPPKSQGQTNNTEAAPAPPPPNLRPADIVQILRRQRERLERVRAK